MIIKYRNRYGNWSWLSDVSGVTEISKTEESFDPDQVIEEYGFLDEFGDYGSPKAYSPYCAVLEIRDGKPLPSVFYTNEMYLTNDTDGSTIEVLVPK